MPRSVLALALLAVAAPVHAERLEILPSGHPVGTFRVDGAGERRFVIDTAAGRTAIVPGLRVTARGKVASAGARTLSGASGETRIDLVALDRIRVDGRVHRSVEVVALPPGPVDALGVDGVLGTDLFGAGLLEMDMPGRRWDLHDRLSPRLLAGMLPAVPISLDGQRLAHVTVRIDGVAVQAIVDTGARGSIINWAAARALGLDPEDGRLAAGAPIKGATDQAMKSAAASFGRLVLGEATFQAPKFRIADLPVFDAVGIEKGKPAMILGIDLLADRRILVDYPGRRLYVSPPVRAAAPSST